MAKKANTAEGPPAVKDIVAIGAAWVQRVGDPESLTITNQEQYDRAGQVMADVDSSLKEMEKKRLEIARPINAGLKKLKEEVDAAKHPLETILEKIKELRFRWSRDQEAQASRLQQEQEQARRAQITQQAQMTGRPEQEIAAYIPPPPPVRMAPKTTVLPDGGSVGVTRTQSWRRTGEQIPYEWSGEVLYQLDEAAIWRLRRKAGEDLSQAPPGIEFYYSETTVHRSGR